MFEYVLFDLDGTLTDPALGITNSIMYALGKMGREIPARESLYRFIGPPLVPSFCEFLGMSAEEAQDALRLYREYFGVRGLFENEVYPEIPAALEKIRDSGRKLLVATSKPEHYARRILEHFALDEYFDLICGATMDEKRVKKADVISCALDSAGVTDEKKDGVIMVGDRLHDVEGAKENRISSLGVLWGYGSRDELTDAGADFIAADTDEMLKIILKK
ncbi:MAG: HAD family hydrolase [Eubacteriales bacterium]